MPPAYVKPYVRRGNNDATDAAAICEAVTRPSMRFVPVKSADQQSVLMLHRVRALLIRQRTMLINALRAHLAEFGIVAAQGVRPMAALIERVFGQERESAEIPPLARMALEPLLRSSWTCSRGSRRSKPSCWPGTPERGKPPARDDPGRGRHHRHSAGRNGN